MLRKWLIDGELHDPFDEFFIGCNDADVSTTAVHSSAASTVAWNTHFVLRPSMIPNWLSPTVAQQVLRTGKAIHFLRSTQKSLAHSIWDINPDTKQVCSAMTR
jgi:gamma-tubulin complex component 3